MCYKSVVMVIIKIISHNRVAIVLVYSRDNMHIYADQVSV